MTILPGKLCVDGLLLVLRKIKSGVHKLPIRGVLRKKQEGAVIDFRDIVSIKEIPRPKNGDPRVVELKLLIREDENWEFKPTKDAEGKPVFITDFDSSDSESKEGSELDQ